MDNFKRNYLRRTLSLVLAVIMIITLVPLGVFAQGTGTPTADATTSATYYKKANWENKIKDKSRWKVEDDQTLVRVGGGDPVQMNDIDYDGMFIDANGRYVIRLVYKEKSQASSTVWYRALINFGDLDKFIDFGLSYVLGKDGKTQYKFDPVPKFKGRGFDLGKAAGDRTNNRKNLPINLVLKEGIDLDKLGNENYIVQMRVANGDYTRIYAYAPKGTSMDYSTYTKTTAVDLDDKLGTLFIKGGKQSEQKNATNQEFFMSEFIANPDKYPDKSNLGIIRTQYMGQTNTIVRETVGGEPIAFTQVFDANLVKYMQADSKGNVAYVNVMTNGRVLSPVTKNVGIPKEKINYSKDGKLAYFVIGTGAFQKDGVNVVNIPKLDQHVMLSGFYITAIDYVVDKSEFENTFSNDKVRKLNYSMMSGWTNPNKDGWVIYEKEYENDYVVPEGESYLIDTGDDPTGGQIMIQVGGDQAILRKPQGYYNGYVSGDGANDAIEKYANGVYKFTLREGATIFKGKKLKVYMPYTSSHDKPVNFLEINNATKRNQGAATLTLNNDRNITMHIFKEGKKGHFVLKYTLADGKESSMEFTPKVLWKYSDKDRILTGVPNTSADGAGGNFYINTKKLQPGADIFVESYDEKGNKIDDQTSWFKYVPLTKANDNVKELTWTDHSDKKSVLSINKSLYTPYQLLFTNDYAEGTDDFYKDPRAFTGTDKDFMKDTKEFVGYTKYDGGKVRTLYEEGTKGKLIAKVEAEENDYDKDGNIVQPDVRKTITIPKANIFDPHFEGDSKQYKAYEYKVDLGKMKAYQSEDTTDKSLTLLKDMKFVSTASDGSSLPSDLLETRVRARVLFDTTEGKFADNTKKVVKIVPDNIKFYGEAGYKANGFEGDNVEANTGDKFPEAPKSGTKNFLGWVTAEGKQALQDKTTVSADDFNKVDKKDVFRADTPVTKHLIVYAIYSEETSVTFDANGGKFKDDKEQTTVKADNGSVTAPTPDPERDGYTFKGWAATKDAPTADADILKNVTDSKTVYAVWEKKAEAPLTLNNPTNKVEVKDPTSLTSDEIAKVKKAVKDANPDLNLSDDDITVAKDGTVTVKKGNQTGTIAKENTVTQKLVENKFNPPEKPIPVGEIGNLTNDETAAIKEAIKKANPDRNLKDEEITINKDGSVSIKQGGKFGTIPADKTVVQTDTILDLKKPEEKDKVEVKNPANLTQKERDEVADAVKKANTSLTNPTVDVDSKGNVTVTVKEGGKTKTGTLEAKDTVKPFTRDGKKLNPPAQKVKVGDTTNLNEAEKQAVRDAVKAANPELDFKDDEIQVDSNGAVTVPMGDTKTGNIPANETVEAAKETDKIIKLVAPETKTPVANKEKLTKDEKDKVIAAVKDANPSIKNGYDITVSDDGTVTVTQGEGENQKVGQLSPKDTVEEKLKAPKINAAKDGSVTVKPADENAKEIVVTYTPAGSETDTTLTATKTNGKWKLPDGTDKNITVDENTGEITLPANKVKNGEEVKAVAKDGSKESETATVNASDTTAPGAPTVASKDDGAIEITPPGDDDTNSITIAYKDQAGNPQTLVATKENGEWKLPEGTDTSIKIDKTTGAVTLPKDKIKAGEKVTAKAKDANDNESVAGEATPVNKVDLKAEVDKNNDDAIKNSDKYKNADQTKKDAYDKALKDAQDVINNPKATQDEVDKAKQALENARNALDGQATPDTTKPAAPTVKANDDGSVEITPAANDDNTKSIEVTYIPEGKTEPIIIKAKKDGNTWKFDTADAPEGLEIDSATGKITIPANKVKDSSDVSAVAKNEAGDKSSTPVTAKTKSTADITDPTKPTDKIKVGNKNGLTDEEKGKVKTAIETANQDKFPKGTKVVVDNTGKATITYPDGSTDTIEASELVEEKAEADKTQADKFDPKKPTEKVKVTDPTNLNDGEKTKVKEAIENANKDGEGNSTFPKPTEQGQNPTKVEVDEKGNATITYPDNSTDKIKGSDLVELDKKPLEDEVNKETTTKASDKYNNAEQDKKTAYDEALRKAKEVLNNPNATKEEVDNAKTALVNAEKALDGTTKPAGELNDPAKVAVKNPASLTDDEKAAIKKAVKDANPGLTDDQIKVNDDGSVTVTKQGEDPKTIAKGKTVSTDVNVPAITEVDNTSSLSPDEKTKVTDAVKKANSGLTNDQIEVKDDGTVIVKKDNKETIIPAKDVVKAKDNGQTPTTKIKEPKTKVEVDNSKALSDEDKDKVKKAVEDANKDSQGNSTLPEGAKIEVADDGTVTVKDKTGKEIAKITPDKTVKQNENKLPVQAADPIPVENPDHLTDAEKAAIKKAIKEANSPDLDDADIDVADDGTVTVKKGNKSTTIPANRTRKAMPRPDYADIYYPDTTIGVGDERKIYPSGYPGYVSTLPGDIDAPRGVYVRVNHDGSIDVEVSPRYTGPSMFTITGYVDVDGKIAPISIRIRVIDDHRSDRRRQRMDKRDEMDKEDELIDTREVLTHKAYIFGYPDGTVRPNGFITRAEAAAMLSRLLNEENTSSAAKPAFIDTPSKWYNNAINAVVARGIMRGYSDGSFKPNAPITRAEFAQMISAIDAKPFGTAPFADVKGHWAELAIGKEYAAGRISGYPNGTFRPDAPITRAEAAHILNKIFERNYDLVSALQSNDKGNIKFFTDLSTSFWGYNDMVEATNTHTFRRRVKGMVQEDWSEINRISH